MTGPISSFARMVKGKTAGTPVAADAASGLARTSAVLDTINTTTGKCTITLNGKTGIPAIAHGHVAADSHMIAGVTVDVLCTGTMTIIIGARLS